MKYLNILYNEYLQTLNSPNKNQNILKEGFSEWLEEKSKILPLYEQFLQSFDLTPSRGIVELDKSTKDSILPYTPYDTKGFLVSNHVNTSTIDKKGIMNINGKIVLKHNDSYQSKKIDIMLEYKNQRININHIKNFVTHFPLEEKTIKIMAELMKIDQNVFIGTYGKLNEKNRMDNLKKLYNLKQELSKYLNKNIEGEVVYTREYYLSVIAPKLKYKEKVK